LRIRRSAHVPENHAKWMIAMPARRPPKMTWRAQRELWTAPYLDLRGMLLTVNARQPKNQSSRQPATSPQ
jgi:hypothetical protein